MSPRLSVTAGHIYVTHNAA